MENIKFKKGSYLIAMAKNKKMDVPHSEYKQGYLFAYAGIDYGITKNECDWTITHINSGLMVAKVPTRKATAEKLAMEIYGGSTLSDLVKKTECTFKSITDYPIYEEKEVV